MPVQQSYPDYQTQSGWNALLPPRQPNDTLDSEVEVPVAIIGAGFTGIAAAKRWAKHSPNDQIALIDSSEVGEGNPGRNSGFLLEVSLAEDADHSQIDRMAKSNALLSQTMKEIVEDVKNSGAEVDMQRRGTYRAAAGSVGLKSLSNYRKFLEAANLPFEDLSRSELNSRIGTEFFQEGLYSPHCYLVQPAQLIRALAESLPDSVSLYENTPALTLRKSSRGWEIETPSGKLIAGKVILANNAFAKQLGVGQSRLAAMYTYAALTPRLSDSQLDALGSDSNWGVLPTHRLGSTLRRTEDGRLLIRSHHGYEKEDSASDIEHALKQRLTDRFPALEATPFDQLWGGAVGFTYNGGAFWGEVEPNLFVSAGCNGGGTVKGTLLGALLVDHAHKMKTANVSSLFGEASWMPPEPFRYIGFHATSTLDGFRGRSER